MSNKDIINIVFIDEITLDISNKLSLSFVQT